jgi:hypothetical protein
MLRGIKPLTGKYLDYLGFNGNFWENYGEEVLCQAGKNCHSKLSEESLEPVFKFTIQPPNK